MKYIILAGGKGSRLQEVVSDVPKPMADINNKPFLEYLLNYLYTQNIKEVILSVGYKQDVIIDYFGNYFNGINISYSKEDTPLGTGGAIKQIDFDEAIVINGDTFFELDYSKFIEFSKNNKISLSITNLQNADRYGAVKCKGDSVIKFEEKKFYKEAYINTGIYYLKKEILKNTPNIFSFEEFLEKNIDKLQIKAFKSKGFFIDIGIPKDYFYAKKVLK